MADTSNLRDIADRLRAGYGGTPVEPIRDAIGGDNADAAYAIQDINTEIWLAGGRRLAGRKIGLTSEKVQQQMGIDQPDYGMLFADMQVPNGGAVPFQALLQPKIEAEIALVLGRDLPEGELTVEDMVAATDYLVPALEIVDSRIRDWNIALADTIADNASSAQFVLGDDRNDPNDTDVVNCRMVMTENGKTVSEGIGAACLGNPFRAGVWLATKMAEVGRPLRRGDIVLTGALGPMANVRAGATYEARFDGIGAVSVTFLDQP